MNEKNLIPFSQLTENEQRAMKQKGGIASGQARREKKALREQMQALLDVAMKDKAGQSVVNPLTGEPLTYCMAMLVKQVTAAANGDIKAAEFCLRAAGMLDAPTVQNNTQINITTKTAEERYNEVYGRIEDAELLKPTGDNR